VNFDVAVLSVCRTEVSSPKTFEHRFGSITRAYELIGCLNPRVSAMLAMRSHTQNLREEMIRKLRSLFPGDLTVIQRPGRWRTRLRLRTGRCISVLVAKTVRPWKTLALPVCHKQLIGYSLERTTCAPGFRQDFGTSTDATFASADLT
jgi:hypothetical protein